MHPSWKQESELAKQLENQQNSQSINPSISTCYREFLVEDLIHFDQIIAAMENVQDCILYDQEQDSQLDRLLDFLRQLREDLPLQSPEQIFGRTQPLIQWLLWLPASMLRGEAGININKLIVLAHFFGVGLALGSLFSGMGLVYFKALSLGPLEHILRVIEATIQNSMNQSNNPELQQTLSLLDFPRHLLARHRDYLQWTPTHGQLPMASNLKYSSSPSQSSDISSFSHSGSDQCGSGSWNIPLTPTSFNAFDITEHRSTSPDPDARANFHYGDSSGFVD